MLAFLNNLLSVCCALAISLGFSVSSVCAGVAGQVEIFANRGVLEETPENTFASFRRALELGIDGILVDVRQTRDDQLVLMCDETIDRTTDGKGRVDQLLYAEIQQYDAGSWRGNAFRNERVPLLSDALKFCKANNLKLILNVRQPCLEKQTLELIKTCGMASQVYLWGTLRNVGAGIGEEEWSGRELVFVPSEEMVAEKIERVHGERKYVFSTILNSDDRKSVKEHIKAGVDVILTDYPCVPMDVLGITSRKTLSRKPPGNKREDVPADESEDNAKYIRDKAQSLITAMEDKDYGKARTAALSLMVLPPKYTLPLIVGLLENRQPEARQNAAWTLGFYGKKDALTHLQPLLNDRHAEVRREAVLALKRLGDRQSVPVLSKMLKTETHPWVKYDVARALGTLGASTEVFPMVNVITNKEEKNWPLKSACVEAIGRIGSENAVRPLADVLVTDAGENAVWARTHAAWALAALGEKSIPFLTDALKDKESSTRRRAGWALVKIGAPAVKPLINSLSEVSKFTRERAALTLGWIGDERAVTALMWALKDKEPVVVSAAAWALGRIGHANALVALQELVNHADADVRDNAVEAIERIKD